MLLFGVLRVWDVGCWVGAGGAWFGFCGVDGTADRGSLLAGGFFTDLRLFVTRMHRRELFYVEFLETGSPGTCQLPLIISPWEIFSLQKTL